MIWAFINKYLGWRNWSVFYYNSIFENLFIFFYIAILEQRLSIDFIAQIILFLIFSLFSTTYGYLINDYADLELDKLHQKNNTFLTDTKKKAVYVILLIFFLMTVFLTPFITKPYFFSIWLLWLFLSTFYSVKPIRFKEKGKLGLAIVIFAQRFLPVLLLLSAFNFFILPDSLLILIYVLIRGATSDMNHQLEDYDNDLDTRTFTSAIEVGKFRFQILFNIMVEQEKIVLFLILLWMAIRMDYFEVVNISLFFLVPAAFILIYLYEISTMLREKKMHNPYAKDKNISQVLLLALPNVVLPVLLLFRLITLEYNYLIFIIIILLIYRLFSVETIKSSGIYRFISKLKGS